VSVPLGERLHGEEGRHFRRERRRAQSTVFPYVTNWRRSSGRGGSPWSPRCCKPPRSIRPSG